jgi:hypothetical protein
LDVGILTVDNFDVDILTVDNFGVDKRRWHQKTGPTKSGSKLGIVWLSPDSQGAHEQKGSKSFSLQNVLCS